MSNSLNTLREGVATLTEAFTEVEDELDSSVYAAMHPALKQVQENLTAASVNLENFVQVQRILEAMSKSDGAIRVDYVDALINQLPPREVVVEAPPARPARRPRERAVPQEAPRGIAQRIMEEQAARRGIQGLIQDAPVWPFNTTAPARAEPAGRMIVDDIMTMEPLDMLRAMTQNGQAGAA